MFTKEQLEGILVSLASPEISIEKDRKQSIGYRIRLVVKIRAMNYGFLSVLQETLEEYGIDSYLKTTEHCNRKYPILRITSINNLLQFFKLIPNIPKHCVDYLEYSDSDKFESFLEVLTIVSNKHHLTQKGFDKILEIKGLST
tara:strand:+ start:96 stop:524 length:429 start_codon:yes stop_codon:yes gene_type:complete